MERILGIVTKICRWLVYIAAGCLAIGMILNTVDVVAAKWLGWSIPGALDITEELMVYITILPIAYLALERDHIRITIVQERASSGVRKALKILSYTIGVLVMGFMTWRVFTRFVYAVEAMELKKGIDLPIWPANLAVVLGFAFLAFVYILLLIKTAKSDTRG
ncbi:MAG TPA: TRAP transporter small permease [Dehalococcoidia bacterium]|nr:TRAP transporter small permease [Dehalococcoidia bacterium]